MTRGLYRDSFALPAYSRRRLLDNCTVRDLAIPERGSNFFIHLSELCPVACEHCMYSSDLNTKSVKTSLDPDELGIAIDFINQSRSDKLTISGGGEPFLKFESICQLLESVDVPRIEIVTAGYWGTTVRRAARLLNRLERAAVENDATPHVLVRLSIDEYHLTAPNPVTIEQYANVVRAWNQTSAQHLEVGYRSLQSERGTTDRMLAAELGARLEYVDEMIGRFDQSGARSFPITYNVFRLAGKAKELEESSLPDTQSIRQYYPGFGSDDGGDTVNLATAVNDAIHGQYSDADGVAITLDSDGMYWIFCGTAPDRRLDLASCSSFTEAITHFCRDPITVLLLEHGIWEIWEIVEAIDEELAARVLAENDVTRFVESLLENEHVLWSVSAVAAGRLYRDGRIELDEMPAMLRHMLSLPEAELVAAARDHLCHSVP